MIQVENSLNGTSVQFVPLINESNYGGCDTFLKVGVRFMKTMLIALKYLDVAMEMMNI